MAGFITCNHQIERGVSPYQRLLGVPMLVRLQLNTNTYYTLHTPNCDDVVGRVMVL